MANNKALPYQSKEIFVIPPEYPHLTIIGLDTEDTASTHDLWDKRIRLPVSEALVNSIARNGVEKAVLVTKNGKRADNTYILEVIDGKQRTRAARVVNEQRAKQGLPPIQIPCSIRRGDGTTLRRVMLSVNAIRQDDNVLDKIEEAVHLLSTASHTKDEVCTTYGISRETLETWLNIDELHPKVKTAILEGKISATAAVKLHDKKREEQPAILEKILSEPEKVTARSMAHKLKEHDTKTRHDAPPSKKEINRILSAVAASKVSLSADTVLAIQIMSGIQPPKASPEFLKALRYVRKEQK